MNPRILVTQPITRPALKPQPVAIPAPAPVEIPNPSPQAPPLVTASLLEKQSVAVCRAQLNTRAHAALRPVPSVNRSAVTQPLSIPHPGN